jgi:hypothetical protein
MNYKLYCNLTHGSKYSQKVNFIDNFKQKNCSILFSLDYMIYDNYKYIMYDNYKYMIYDNYKYMIYDNYKYMIYDN